ncbi:MAG: hypothetical protein AAF078_00255 [Planctomycetota bacterium]
MNATAPAAARNPRPAPTEPTAGTAAGDPMNGLNPTPTPTPAPGSDAPGSDPTGPRVYKGRTKSTLAGPFTGVDKGQHMVTTDPFYLMAGRVAVLLESISRELVCLQDDRTHKLSDAVSDDTLKEFERAMHEAWTVLHHLSHASLEMYVAGLFEKADSELAELRRVAEAETMRPGPNDAAEEAPTS